MCDEKLDDFRYLKKVKVARWEKLLRINSHHRANLNLKKLDLHFSNLKFIYSEKATKFCEISNLDLTVLNTVKSKVEISQNFETFSEYINAENKSREIFNAQN